MVNDKFQRTSFPLSVHRPRGVVPTALYVIHHVFMFEAPELASKGFAPDLVVRGGGVERAAEICAFRVRAKVQNAMHWYKSCWFD
jgi:hypothetical protein